MVDPYMFIWDDCILLVYLDDVLVAGKSKEAIESSISSLKMETKIFEFTEQGSISHYLGVKVVRSQDPKCKSFELCQPYLINKFVEHIGLTLDVKGQESPVQLPLSHKDFDGP
eukprot:3189753-Ditylum_brightwellii.AAC.1